MVGAWQTPQLDYLILNDTDGEGGGVLLRSRRKYWMYYCICNVNVQTRVSIILAVASFVIL